MERETGSSPSPPGSPKPCNRHSRSERSSTGGRSFSLEFCWVVSSAPLHLSASLLWGAPPVCAMSLQSRLTLCHPMDHSLQAPLSMGFFRQERWIGLPRPSSRGSCGAQDMFQPCLMGPREGCWQRGYRQSEQDGVAGHRCQVSSWGRATCLHLQTIPVSTGNPISPSLAGEQGGGLPLSWPTPSTSLHPANSIYHPPGPWASG